MDKKIYLGTNTKMYKNSKQTREYLIELQNILADISQEKITIFVIPSFTTLESAAKCILDGKITLGAQNMGWEDEGQFTGEISPLMLKEFDIKMVEIGHSERRHILGETDWMENKKVKTALRHRLIPLLCIGETLEQKELGIGDEILRIQLKTGLHEVKGEEAKELMIAYEPVWAIGTAGIPASTEYIGAKHKMIKETLQGLFGKAIGTAVPVLYGGSVTIRNAESLIEVTNVDGLFIGRSAWNPVEFDKIIRKILSRVVNMDA
jgi:L-erythrulose 1-phosphate isomerase